VEALVHDRSRTLLLPVTLHEELPVLETHELIERSRDQIDIAVDRIVVNRVPNPTPGGLHAALERLPDDLALEQLPPVPTLRAVLGHVDQRNRLALEQRRHVSRLCALPVVDVPDLPLGFEPDGGWSEIAEAILATPCWPEAEGAAGESTGATAHEGAA
jgi:hypothetical protein